MTSIFGGIDFASRALDFHLQRQNLIAANVANVDTPGYVPVELTRPTKPHETGKLGMHVTNETHIALGDPAGEMGFETVEERAEIPGNDLNYVSLDREMARLNANSLRFEAVGKLLSKHMGILTYAATNANRS